MARRLYLYSSYPALHRGRRASPTVLLLFDHAAGGFPALDDFSDSRAFAFRPYRRRWADPIVQFFVLWFFSVFLFFTFSDTKRDLYLLPLMPTLALFVGSYFDDLATGKIALSAAYQGLTIAFFGLVVIAGFAVPLRGMVRQARRLRGDAADEPSAPAAVEAALCCFYGVAGRSKLPRRSQR